MNVISIQSQVAWGHVGNSAAVFPMQLHGIDVTAVPTTLLSNRPGYPTIRGRVLDAQLVSDLLLGIEERGAADACSMIVSGYLGSSEIAAVVADFVISAKARNPALLYCCDPVLGDRDRLRRAGAHRGCRHRGNAHRRERRTARSPEAPVRGHSDRLAPSLRGAQREGDVVSVIPGWSEGPDPEVRDSQMCNCTS
jgi:hypothetical protein